MRGHIAKILASKLSTDIAWTMGSFVVLAVSGVLINILVVYFRTAADLGVFNLAYSIYIVTSQIAVLGIHYSVLRHAAYHSNDRDLLGTILGSACLPALAMGVFWAGMIFLLGPGFEWMFDSERAARSISIAALGIALFPLTKVLISFLNSQRDMKAFSLLQAGRYIVVTVVVTLFAASDWDFDYAPLAFVIAETITLVGAVARVGALGIVRHLKLSSDWLRKHIRFGSKSLAAGMFGEVNTRVDVLMLGMFLSDTAVGIYSFAAMLLDGLYHLLAMVRVNFNPLLVAATRDGRWSDANKILRLSKLFAPLLIGALSVGLLILYWAASNYVFPEKGLLEGLPALFVLLAGLVVVSGLVPFDNLLLVSGYPGYQTLQQFVAVLANVLVNAALIPVWGIVGASAGTAASYVCGTWVLLVMSRRLVGWNLMTGVVRGSSNGTDTAPP
ncbi:hypothetical protein RHAB21_04216 [Pseudorhizobium halotolerans]|uniref:O-antigen/teichoic acid export membrane protein n=1 Tax=Pseudorhizobium halotolerans TaxID=1233081 RepID=A0ABN7JWD9_9HYPH|nr:polysaccharide biosynthesis C-terminal domain-containing protein [Pseudorhizobium halotolerans]CAD7050785.1 hypothetical protein RHAB21_04216 [Pseudorhizobium halotolerans]